MITEDYVSFETAKLLKETGFDEGCHSFYDYTQRLQFIETVIYDSELNEEDNECVAPTIQMAVKWLRKIHHIHIELNWEKGNQLYSFQIWKPGKFQPEISSLDLWRIYKDDNYIGEWNYEEASEEAIKYCLENLI